MNLHDAIKQARDARVNPYAPYVCEDALRDLITALDDTLPHLVDTRRLEALETIKPSPVSLTVGHLRRPAWWVSLGGDAVGSGPTAAEALDAAEREAGL